MPKPSAESPPRSSADLLEPPSDAVSRMIPEAAADQGRRRPGRRAGDSEALGQASRLVHRLAARPGNRRPAGGVRPGVSAVVRVFPRRSGRARRLAVDRLRDPRAGPVQAGRACCPTTCRRSHTATRGTSTSGSTTSRATTIAGTWCCTRATHGFMNTLLGRVRAAVVHGGDGRVAGHASLARRPAARWTTCRPRKDECRCGDGSRSSRTPLRPGGRRRLEDVLGVRRSRPRRDRALRLVLGGVPAPGPPSPLSSPVPPALRRRAAAGLQRAVSPSVGRRLGPDWPRSGRCSSRTWNTATTSLGARWISRRASPLPPDGTTVEVAADRGWQNSGVRLEAGAVVSAPRRGTLSGGRRPQIWWCEPGGVSIRYYQGRPLGILLAAVHGDESEGGTVGLPSSESGRSATQPAGGNTAGQASGGTRAGSTSPLLRPSVVGLETVLKPEVSGTLFLKINDSAGELGDNAGKLSVRVDMGVAGRV